MAKCDQSFDQTEKKPDLRQGKCLAYEALLERAK